MPACRSTSPRILLSSFVIPCLLSMSGALGAQAPGTPAAPAAPTATTTLSVNARLVNLPVIVRDKKGALIQTLTKADFALTVDGQPQTIRYFDRDTDLPLTLGLLVDVSGSVRNALEEERAASESFLDQMLRSASGDAAPAAATTSAPRVADQAFLIQFAHETELLQDLTSSRPKLREALNQLGTADPHDAPDDSQNDPNGGGGNGGGYGGGRGRHGGGGFHHGGGTTLYDAIFLSGDELMQKQHGRKALVVLTDGEDRGSKETLASAIEVAQKSETVVYAIYIKGESHGGGNHGGGFPGGGGHGGGESHVDGKKILEQISGETGGRMFEVSGKQNFAAIYTQIAEELRSEYRLGYSPDAAGATEGFHHIDLTLPKDRKLIVQTRSGYYSGQ
jgi:VWFA-related protein